MESAECASLSAPTNPSAPLPVSSQVIGPDYCVQLSYTTSTAFKCGLSPPGCSTGTPGCSNIIGSAVFQDDITCSTQGMSGDESYGGVGVYNCDANPKMPVVTDTSKVLISTACVQGLTSAPSPVPTQYVPGTPTTTPTVAIKKAGSSAVGYWVMKNYTSSACGGDPFLTSYTTLGLCSALSDADQRSAPVTAKYGMYDLQIDGMDYTVWQFFFSESSCTARVQGFPYMTIHNFKTGRCRYFTGTKTSGSITFLQNAVPPTNKRYVSYPAITRDIFQDTTTCQANSALGGRPAAGAFPTRGEVRVCGACIPDYATVNNIDTLTGGSYRYSCSNTGGVSQLSYQNYTDSKCNTKAGALLTGSLATCYDTRKGHVVGMDDDSSSTATEQVVCLGNSRGPTVTPTTAPTSLTTVVRFEVDQVSARIAHRLSPTSALLFPPCIPSPHSLSILPPPSPHAHTATPGKPKKIEHHGLPL